MPSPMRSLLAALALLAACATPPPLERGDRAALAGQFRGVLTTDGQRGQQQVAMGLDVEPGGTADAPWRFVLHYGDGATAQRRDYLLQWRDQARGEVAIDERNGIVLPGRWRAGTLSFAFTVQGHTNIVTYRALPDGVEFTLVAVQAAVGEPAGEGVLGHPGLVVQRAVLARIAPAAVSSTP